MMLRNVGGLLLGSVVGLALVACSGTSPSVVSKTFAMNGAAVVPLTPDQTQRLKQTVASLGSVLGLAQTYVVKPGAAPHALFTHFVDQVNQDPGLKKAVDESDCTKVIHYPDEHAPLKSGENLKLDIFSIDVSGPGCAVTYHAGVDGTQTKDGFNAVLTYKYQAHSKEALAANDVDSTDLTGKISANSAQSADGTINVQMKMDFGGPSHSQKEGAFATGEKVDMQVGINFGAPPAQPGQPSPPPNQPGFSISITGDVAETSTFQFKDMTGELTSHVAMLGQASKEEYKINGQPVTKAEYAAIHDSLQLPSTSNDDPQGGGGGAQPASVFSCKVEAYLASEYSAADAQKAIDTNTPAPRPPMVIVSACGNNAKVSRTQDLTQRGDTLQADFDFTSPSFAKIEVKTGTSPAAQRYFLPGQAAAFADADPNGFTFVTSCETKPACAP